MNPQAELETKTKPVTTTTPQCFQTTYGAAFFFELALSEKGQKNLSEIIIVFAFFSPSKTLPSSEQTNHEWRPFLVPFWHLSTTCRISSDCTTPTMQSTAVYLFPVATPVVSDVTVHIGRQKQKCTYIFIMYRYWSSLVQKKGIHFKCPRNDKEIIIQWIKTTNVLIMQQLLKCTTWWQ